MHREMCLMMAETVQIYLSHLYLKERGKDCGWDLDSKMSLKA
jgi:hypothetical protein